MRKLKIVSVLTTRGRTAYVIKERKWFIWGYRCYSGTENIIFYDTIEEARSRLQILMNQNYPEVVQRELNDIYST
jgi:hypothetical protein